jgi:branched-chain amino acid transport system ATP-binding protein
MTRPRLVLLDEPSRGLAPVLVADLMALLRRLADQGLVVLLAEQAVSAALAVADRAVVMAHGRVEASGTVEAVRADGALARSFLG